MPTANTPSVTHLKQAIEIAEQIERLQAQLTSLVGGLVPVSPAPRVAATTTPVKRKRNWSAASRERVAAAQRARWAKVKSAAGKSEAKPKAQKMGRPTGQKSSPKEMKTGV